MTKELKPTKKMVFKKLEKASIHLFVLTLDVITCVISHHIFTLPHSVVEQRYVSTSLIYFQFDCMTFLTNIDKIDKMQSVSFNFKRCHVFLLVP
jgi:hypothetical protein